MIFSLESPRRKLLENSTFSTTYFSGGLPHDIKNTNGCPQGSIISPILANIYLHHVIDEWFESIKESHIRGRAELIRFADDMVFTFERREEAIRVYNVLPKRCRVEELTKMVVLTNCELLKSQFEFI